MLARATRPKLTLTVPTVTSPTLPSAAPKSPFVPLSPSSPLSSPTARNTLLNAQRNFHAATLSPLPPPPSSSSAAPAASARKGGILKKAGCACTHPNRGAAAAARGKKISFCAEARVNVVSPMPADYHGDYVRVGGRESRWANVRGE